MKAQDRIFEAYLNGMGEVFGEKVRKRIHWICENVQGKNILDIGCSQGIVDILLGRENKQIIAIDVLQESIDYANEKLLEEEEAVQSNIQFIKANFLEYDLQDKMFDTIIMTEILEHLLDPAAILDKALNHLEDDGRLIITVPFGINDYFDHKRTYYCNGILELLKDKVSIKGIECMGKWIGFIAIKDNKKQMLDMRKILDQVEKNFYEIERELLRNNTSRDNSIKNYQKLLEDLKVENQRLKHTSQEDIKEAQKLVKQKEEAIEKLAEQKEEAIEKLVKQKEEDIKELIKQTEEIEEKVKQVQVLERQYNSLEDLLKEKEEDRELLMEKVISYLTQIEELVNENEAIAEKRQILLDRTEQLTANNQQLVAELKDIKSKYRALSGSKLGKVTLFIWRLKKKISRR